MHVHEEMRGASRLGEVLWAHHLQVRLLAAFTGRLASKRMVTANPTFAAAPQTSHFLINRCGLGLCMPPCFPSFQ